MQTPRTLGRELDLIEEIVDELPDGVTVTDGGGRIVFANARLEEMSGYPRAELVGAPVEMLVPERLRSLHQHHRADYEGSPRTRPMGTYTQTLLRRRDGTEFPVDIALSPTRNRAGAYVISTVRDARERRDLQSRVHRAAERERIARELHDGVIHALFSVGLELQATAALVTDEHVSRRLSSCITSLDDCIRQLRDRVFDLRSGPPAG